MPLVNVRMSKADVVKAVEVYLREVLFSTNIEVADVLNLPDTTFDVVFAPPKETKSTFKS